MRIGCLIIKNRYEVFWYGCIRCVKRKNKGYGFSICYIEYDEYCGGFRLWPDVIMERL